MTDAAALDAALAQPAKRCKFVAQVATFDTSGQQWVADRLAEGLSPKLLARALKTTGRAVSDHTIRQHLSGACRCE